MALKKQNPGCGCCGCPRFSDSFDREDNTDIGSNWAEDVGDWVIASNKLSLHSPTANARASTSLAVIQENDGVDVSVKCASTADGDDLQLWGWRESVSGYYGRATLRVKNGSGNAVITVSIVDAGGTGTYSRSCFTAEPNAEHTLRFCTRASTIEDDYIFSVYLNGVLILWGHRSGSTGIPANSKPALGTGTCTGTVTFDDFAWGTTERLLGGDANGCPPCGAACPWPSVPTYLTATLSNFASLAGCMDCESLNSQYELSLVSSGTCSARWEYQFPSPVCSVEKLVYIYDAYGSSGFFIFGSSEDSGDELAYGQEDTCAGLQSLIDNGTSEGYAMPGPLNSIDCEEGFLVGYGRFAIATP